MLSLLLLVCCAGTEAVLTVCTSQQQAESKHHGLHLFRLSCSADRRRNQLLQTRKSESSRHQKLGEDYFHTKELREGIKAQTQKKLLRCEQ
jgi:hypothetical protein